MSIRPVRTGAILSAFPAAPVASLPLPFDGLSQLMSTCPQTGLTLPECSCSRCIEDQLKRFAPGFLTVRRLHDPLVPREVRSIAVGFPPVAERLERPAL
jgi:hypothetical protein